MAFLKQKWDSYIGMDICPTVTQRPHLKNLPDKIQCFFTHALGARIKCPYWAGLGLGGYVGRISRLLQVYSWLFLCHTDILFAMCREPLAMGNMSSLTPQCIFGHCEKQRWVLALEEGTPMDSCPLLTLPQAGISQVFLVPAGKCPRCWLLPSLAFGRYEKMEILEEETQPHRGVANCPPGMAASVPKALRLFMAWWDLVFSPVGFPWGVVTWLSLPGAKGHDKRVSRKTLFFSSTPHREAPEQAEGALEGMFPPALRFPRAISGAPEYLS